MLLATIALWCFASERNSTLQTISFTELSDVVAESQPMMQMPKEFSVQRFQKGSVALDAVEALQVRLRQNRARQMSDITGTRQLMAHVSNTHACYGGESTVSAIGNDSVKIDRFCFGDVSIYAKVDLTTGMVSIPSQYIGTVSDLKVYLCKMDFHKGIYDTEAELRGHIYKNSIIIDDGFGFFVTEGPQAGAYLTVGLMEYAAIADPNATFTAKRITFKDNTLTTENRQVTDQVSQSFIYPIGTDRFRIMRVPIATTYSDLTARLMADSTVKIDPQPVYYNSLTGDYCIYNMAETVEGSNVKFSISVLTPILLNYNEAGKTLGFNSYGIARPNGLLSMYESASVTMTEALTFPQPISMNLEGEGTAENPWLIKSVTDLQALAADILTNTQYRTEATDADGDKYYQLYAGKYFKLAADLDFSDVLFEPIGDATHWFAGSLIGDGRTITNLTIQDFAYDYCGLFSHLAPGASVSNLKFKGAYITSLGYTAGVLAGRSYATISDVEITNSRVLVSAGYNAGMLVGYSHAPITNVNVSGAYIVSLGYMGGLVGRSYANITNCHVEGRVIQTGKQVFSGGLVGHQTKTAIDDPAPVVSNCSFTGSVQALGDEIGLGGLMGGLSYSRLENCFANAVVTNASAISAYVGGLAGTTYQAELKDCYASGYVRNPESIYCGGLVGHNTKSISGEIPPTTITNCYSSVMLITKSTEAARGIAGDVTNITITDSYFDNQIGIVPDGTYGLPTVELTGATLPQGFSTDKWIATEGMYPRLKGQENSDAAVVSASALRLATGENVNDVQSDFHYSTGNDLLWQAIYDGALSSTRGYAFTFEDGVGKLTYDQYTDTIYVSKGGASKYYLVNIAPVLFPGTGTAADPWIITTADDLKKLSDISNNAQMTFDGRYFALGANIDCKGDTLVPICKDKAAKLFFNGNFDGRGYTIDNFHIVGVGFYTEDNVTGTAVPGQVNPKDVNSYAYCGLFANVGPQGVIRNVTLGSNAMIESFQYGGGIAGGSQGLIENCNNYGTVRGYFSVTGGIVGYLKANAEVRNCYNNGSISVNAYTTGGIVGQAQQATIENCENTGEVSAYWFNPYQKEGSQYGAGGIVGYADRSNVKNVVNSGTVSSYKQVGGIASKVNATATVSATIESALNYGLVYSSVDKTSLGSIAGLNTLGTYVNCLADKQIQKVGLVAGGLHSGTMQLPTLALISAQGYPKEYFVDSVWTLAVDQYPHLKYATVPAQVALNSKAVIRFTANDYASSMMTSAPLAQGVNWSLITGSVFNIADNKLNVTKPMAGCFTDTIVATLDGCTRKIPIATLNPTLTDGEGTMDKPYLIYEPTEYLAIARFMKQFDFDYAGYYFKLMANLDFTDLEFVPMGADGVMFNGSFDGNNKKVRNVNYVSEATDKTAVGRGFFGTIGYDGMVSSLTIESSTISGYQNVGGISGICFGNIIGCTNSATVSTLGTTGAGGITGYAAVGSMFSLCSNTGVVTAKTNYAGGIIGSAPASASLSVAECSNAGTVKGTSKIGGIIGSGSAHIYDCSNTGSVTATSTYSGGIIGEALLPSSVKKCNNSGAVTANQYMGGVVGMSVAHNNKTPFEVTDCHNTVDLTPGTKGFAGGVLGQIKAGAHITLCSNTGNINGSTTTSTHLRIGGIASDLASSASTPSLVEKCYNTGDILCWSNSGGLIGAASGDSLKIKECWNRGNITGGYTTATNVGGILGNGPAQFFDCWNSGNIFAKGKQAGGINGTNTAKSLTMTRCVNVGNVTAEVSDAGGMIGLGRATITNCYNLGAITAPKAAGGLIGEPGNAASPTYTVYVHDCYNSGKITAETNFGNIMGKNASCKYLEVGRVYANTDTTALTEYDNTLNVTGMNTVDLIKFNITPEFLLQEGTLPTLQSFKENELLNFYATTLLPATNETLQAVKTSLTIGTPFGVQWTVVGPMSIQGNTVTNKATEDNVAASLTLICGGLTRTWNLNLMKANSGVTDIDIANVLRVEYYRMDGTITTATDPSDMLIERTVYKNGSYTVRKIINRKR